MRAELVKPIDQIILLINALADDVSRQERTLRALARAVEWYKETTAPKTPQQHQEIMEALKELKRLSKPEITLCNAHTSQDNATPAFHDPHNPDLVLEGPETALEAISGATLSVKPGNPVNVDPTEELYERLHEDHGA